MQVTFTRIRTSFSVFLPTFILLMICMAADAQVKFSTVVNETQPGLNEYVQVEYTVENAKSVENISAPSFKNFRLIQGPIQSSGMSVTNGALSQFKSVSYVLQPLVAGKINIPGAMAVVDGKMIKSNAVMIDVKNSGAGGNGNNNNSSSGITPFMPGAFPDEEPRVSEEYVLKPGEKMSDKIRKNIFVIADINKTVCYEGEPIMATFKLCSRLRSESTVLKRPSLNGFSVYDMIEPAANHPAVETIGGKTFNVHTIRKTQLFPLQSGTFIIDPVELTNKVTFLRTAGDHAPSRDPMQRMMDEFMNDENRGELEEQSFSLASKPVSITVKPLPEAGKPAGFNGAVGKFTIQAYLENKVIPAGDPITLKVQIKGEGNFTVINSPALQLPAGLDVYEPIVKETVDKSVYPLNGTKTFTYTFTARKPGNYKIPPTFFSYFDPSKGNYETARSDFFNIKVVASKKSLFKFNRSGKAESFNWRNYIPSNVLWGILAAVIAIVLSYVLVRKRRPEKAVTSSSPVLTVTPTPVIASTNEELLEKARLALTEERSQDFYGEVNKAVWRKISETMKIPSTELNKFNVVSQLRGKGIHGEVLNQLEAVLHECEIALYTPVHSTSDMQHTLGKAEEVIKAL